MRINFFLFVVTLLLLLTSVSCGDPGCQNYQGDGMPMVRFYDYNNTSTPLAMYYSVYGIRGNFNDTILIENAKQSSAFNLSLSTKANESGNAESCYVIKFNQPQGAANDTLCLKYKINPYFISVDCGAEFNFEITDMICTYHTLDSAALIDKKVVASSVDNIRLYYAIP